MKIKERTMWRRIDESTDGEFRCDWCGFSSDNENRFTEIGDQTVCRMCLSRSKYDEGWLGDKMKAGWEKVKTGAKKLGKAIGDAFNGPFRKGDHIVMKGENGEEFKGTIKDYDRGDKTYEVLLGNAVNEDWDGRGLQEDVLDMPDRPQEIERQLKKNEEELYNMLSDEYKDNEYKFHHHSKFDELLEERDALVEELCGCRGLIKEETREEIEYLKSIGEYDDYKKMIRALKAKNAKKKSTKKPAKKPAKKASEMKRSFVYTINASGYYKSYHFSTKKECLEEMKKDAEATALDYDGELNWHDEYECEVVDKEGQRIAAFCYVGTWNH